MLLQNMKATRVEKHVIKKSHPMYKTIDTYSFRSKNLYNYANYMIRNEFIKNGNYIQYPDSSKNLSDKDERGY